ncbi:hypothetical protein COOONC_23303 [Cooperia oncophora]
MDGFRGMDSDSDEDRLYIVEEENDRSRTDAETEREKSIEKNVTDECKPPALTVLSKQEKEPKVTLIEDEPSSGRRQQRSRLPASLKERIVRSSARTSALSSEVIVLQAKQQQRRLPKAVRFSKKDTPVVVKLEQTEPTKIVANELLEPLRSENDICPVKQESDKSYSHPPSEKPPVLELPAAANPICGRKRFY